ncbi:MAG: hypothetical protein KJ915_12030 [Candidatus Omnitrophica bacterium]|nr:hypothetical protein [Candidatus Omnitrophota bacterium]
MTVRAASWPSAFTVCAIQEQSKKKSSASSVTAAFQAMRYNEARVFYFAAKLGLKDYQTLIVKILPNCCRKIITISLSYFFIFSGASNVRNATAKK